MTPPLLGRIASPYRPTTNVGADLSAVDLAHLSASGPDSRLDMFR